MSDADIVTLTPGAIELRDLARIMCGARAVLDPAALPRVEAAAAVIAWAAQGEEAVYGVNTGFGKLASQRIPPEQTAALQRNLIVSHCCGVGPSMPTDALRLMIALKIASLGRGASGVRPLVIRMLEAIQTPRALGSIVVPTQGSVGASGDLAPLAHLTAFMIGEPQVSSGITQAGLQPIVLGPKEGLALINGTQFSCACAVAALLAVQHLAAIALITGALSVDAAMASTTPFRAEIHALRAHAGQIATADVLWRLLDASAIRQSHLAGDTRVQDPYCLRCQPQVMGAALDLIDSSRRTLAVEINAVTDNPLVLVETGEIVSGGNFHAEPVAFAADQLAIAVSEIGAIAERRIATLVDPALNFGLPPFLTPEPGLNSGFMIAEVTAAALFAENKHLATPCSLDSTPTSANQEDHVSMAAHAAVRLQRMTDNLSRILAVELLVAAQGIGLRAPLTTSPPLQRVIARLRADVPALGADRFLANDIEHAQRLVMSPELILAAGRDLFPAHMLELSACMSTSG